MSANIEHYGNKRAVDVMKQWKQSVIRRCVLSRINVEEKEDKRGEGTELWRKSRQTSVIPRTASSKRCCWVTRCAASLPGASLYPKHLELSGLCVS